MRGEVQAERLRPSTDFVRLHVEGHEHDALAEAQILADPGDQVLELPDPRRARQEDRVVRREAFLH